MKQFLIAALLLMTLGLAKGQYTFQTTMNPYVELQNPISLDQGNEWGSSSYQVYFNFNFDILGQPHSALNVLPWGGISFGGLGMKELFVFHTPFGGYWLRDKGEGTGSTLSPVDYEITGSPGSQILKIQWKNAGFKQWFNVSDTADYVDFQIWLYEQGGRMDVRFGNSSTDPGTYGYPDGTSNPNPGTSLKWWFDGCSNVLALTGSANLPSYNFYDICSPNYYFIQGTPNPGITYIFNPTAVSVAPSEATGIQVAPSVTATAFKLSGLDAAAAYESAELRGISGKVVRDLRPVVEGQEEALVNVEGLASGLYFMRLEDAEGEVVVRKVVVQ